MPDQITINSSTPQLLAPPVARKLRVTHIGGSDLAHGDKTLREGSSVVVHTPGEEFAVEDGSATVLVLEEQE